MHDKHPGEPNPDTPVPRLTYQQQMAAEKRENTSFNFGMQVGAFAGIVLGFGVGAAVGAALARKSRKT